jgi:hypothetical protein
VLNKKLWDHDAALLKMKTSHDSKNMVPCRFSKNDIVLLSSIYEHQVVTIKQLSAINRRSCQIIRRRIRFLEGQGLLVRKPFGYGISQGRPEEIVSLTHQGVESLSIKGIVPIPHARYEDIRFDTIDHNLLLNWFRIHMIQIERGIPDLSVISLSPWHCLSKHKSIFTTNIPAGQKRGQQNDFIPDGIFVVKNNTNEKALLFFLEVDMNTESMTSKSNNTNNIQHKIFCYQEIYRNGNYKFLEEVVKSTLQGFRLLFLTSTETRVAALCRFVQKAQNSDFIWLSDQRRMFEHGLSANIWVRGAKYENPRESILGPKHASDFPLMSTIR